MDLPRPKRGNENKGRSEHLQFLRYFNYFCVVEENGHYTGSRSPVSLKFRTERGYLPGNSHVAQFSDAVRERRVRAEKARKKLAGCERRDDAEGRRSWRNI